MYTLPTDAFLLFYDNQRFISILSIISLNYSFPNHNRLDFIFQSHVYTVPTVILSSVIYDVDILTKTVIILYHVSAQNTIFLIMHLAILYSYVVKCA